MIDDHPKFSPLRYLSIVLLIAPLVLTGLMWFAFVLRAFVQGPKFNRLTDSGMDWLTIALGAGIVCLLCEWLVLPMVLPRGHPRPAYTPLVSFAVGLLLAIPALLILRRWMNGG
jgi:hypothetical protein